MQGRTKEINSALIITLSAVFVLIAILWTHYWSFDKNSLITTIRIGQISLLTCVFTAAFFYEVLALAILDRIGLEERNFSASGMIIHTYGLMGIGAAISLWLLNIVKSPLVCLLFTLGACIIVAILMIWKRTFVRPSTILR